MKRPVAIGAALAVVAGLVLVPAMNASAEGGHGIYARWSYDAAADEGAITFGRGYPSGSFSITSAQVPQEIATRRGNFLNASTPFGARFGTSQGSDYLVQRHTSSGGPWQTTYVFDSPMPAGGWGIAFGDLDVDNLHIAAYDANGKRRSVADWFQGGFNFCVGDPQPEPCPGDAPVGATPTWDGVNTLVRVGQEGEGASAWLRPTWDVTKLVVTWAAPGWSNSSYRTWIAIDGRPGNQTQDCATLPTSIPSTGSTVIIPTKCRTAQGQLVRVSSPECPTSKLVRGDLSGCSLAKLPTARYSIVTSNYSGTITLVLSARATSGWRAYSQTRTYTVG